MLAQTKGNRRASGDGGASRSHAAAQEGTAAHLSLSLFVPSIAAAARQEWGEFPSADRVSPVGSLTYDEYKNNVSAEIIHGRFAMLGVTGAWAQENIVGTPWFMAGQECTFDKCEISYLNQSFVPSYDGALLGLIAIEIILMGKANRSKNKP